MSAAAGKRRTRAEATPRSSISDGVKREFTRSNSNRTKTGESARINTARSNFSRTSTAQTARSREAPYFDAPLKEDLDLPMRIMMGDFEELPEITKNCVKIYVASTITGVILKLLTFLFKYFNIIHL